MMHRKNWQAVTVTHIPSGIFAHCESERSQYKNKNLALECLRARLYARTHIDKNNQVVAAYEFPDCVTCPDQIDEYKCGL